MSRSEPERAWQIQIARFLRQRLPDDVYWTASPVGMFLSLNQQARNKAMGVRPDLPDILVGPCRGITCFAEVKTDKGSLSPGQRRFRDQCRASGLDIWDLWRPRDGLEYIDATLTTRWRIPLRITPPIPHDDTASPAANFILGLEE